MGMISDMACTTTSYPAAANMVTTAKPVPGSGMNLSGPYLVVSNFPERVTGANVQLYKCAIPIKSGGPITIRFFIWHLSINGNTFKLGLRLGAGTGTVTNFKGHVEETSDLFNAGICCANAVLYNVYPTNFDNKNLSATENIIFE